MAASESRSEQSPMPLADIRDLCRSFKLEHRANTKAYRGFGRIEYLLTAALEQCTNSETASIERWQDDRRMLIDCLANFVVASDRFVADTGLKHGDMITEAADVARSLVQKLRNHHFDGTPL